jgi:hypothetical protein
MSGMGGKRTSDLSSISKRLVVFTVDPHRDVICVGEIRLCDSPAAGLENLGAGKVPREGALVVI